MPRIDEQAGEINIKIVYHGPGLSGRTTNLQYIYNKTRPEAKGKMVSVHTETEQELFCDFKPLSLGPLRGLRPRVHLHASPGCRYIEGAAERVLQDADGLVFVADSGDCAIDRDIAAMESLETYIARQGRDLAALPLVLQYNKRDGGGFWCDSSRFGDDAFHPVRVLSVAELDALLNRHGRPTVEAVATIGQGVFDTLKSIVGQVLEKLRAAP